MWLSDVSYNLLDISRRRYSRRGYGGCLMKHLSGKSSTAMAERWSDRMEWGREGRITRKVFVCTSVHVSVSQSSRSPGKGRDSMENINIFATANLIYIENEQSCNRRTSVYINRWYKHHISARTHGDAHTHFWTCSESLERLWAW